MVACGSSNGTCSLRTGMMLQLADHTCSSGRGLSGSTPDFVVDDCVEFEVDF